MQAEQLSHSKARTNFRQRQHEGVVRSAEQKVASLEVRLHEEWQREYSGEYHRGGDAKLLSRLSEELDQARDELDEAVSKRDQLAKDTATILAEMVEL